MLYTRSAGKTLTSIRETLEVEPVACLGVEEVGALADDGGEGGDEGDGGGSQEGGVEQLHGCGERIGNGGERKDVKSDTSAV